MTCRYHGHEPGAFREVNPCTCQPPTVWGETFMWHCECCELPASYRRYMLCETCDKHQNASPVTVASDHEDKQLQDAHRPSLTSLRGGGGGFPMPGYIGVT
jgi:hypothetical protein